MSGALLELVALGEQDKHLVGNPQISYFKSVNKSHTNFSMESIPIRSNEEPDFGKLVTFIIEKKGDLLHKILLEIELPQLQTNPETNISWINNIGNYIIDYIELDIGGITIDKRYGQWLDISSELHIPKSHQDGYYEMNHKQDFMTNVANNISCKLFIPLDFWFTKTIGNALPLIALQYHDVKVNIKFKEFKDCYYSGLNLKTNPVNVSRARFTSCNLFCDYIFLDIDERRNFAQSTHEYLIEQLQFNTVNNIQDNLNLKRIELDFNHPVKEIIWVIQLSEAKNYNDWTNYSNSLVSSTYTQVDETESGVVDPTGEILKDAVILINGHERFTPRKAKYFRLVQPFNHHTNIPRNFIYSYSFSLMPENSQPSGSLNFSRIDNSQLSLTCIDNVKECSVNVYAINYNILKIMSGMGGILYSN